MNWVFPFTVLGDYTFLAISNALVVVLLYFSYSLFSQLESIKRQTRSLQTFASHTQKLLDSIDSAQQVIQTLNDPEFRRTINDLRKLQIIYVSHQDESATNQTDCFTDPLSRFVDASRPNLRADFGSVSEYETNSINESTLGVAKSKTHSRFPERAETGSVSECETNSFNERNKSIYPQTLPDLPQATLLSDLIENNHRGSATLLSSELQDDDRGEDLPNQSDHSGRPLGLGYADDGEQIHSGDDFDLPVFNLGFAKLVEEMQLEGFVNEAQSEFLEDIFHSNSRGIFLRNFLQEYNRSPEDLHRLKMDLRTFASNPEEFTLSVGHTNAEDQYSVCASLGSVTTLNSTTNEKRGL